MRELGRVTICLMLAWTCIGSAQTPTVRSRTYLSGLTLPVLFVQDPSDAALQYIVQQAGRIRVVRNGVPLPNAFLDVTTEIASGGERGLLGLAFPPDYGSSGRFFVNFTDRAGNTVVARFHRSNDPLVADHGSRFDLRWNGAGGAAYIAQPFPNHNGGNLVFGPDGFLYIGMGDGGSGNDPRHNAQNPRELLGKMLRIDVSVPDSDAIGYRVPPDNPFIHAGPPDTRGEIWSFGLRNPWRYSFDDTQRGGTGALVIADVGQNRFEEIDYEPAGRGGRNYGWRNREGAHDNIGALPPAFQPLVDPIFEYDHSVGQSITGGYVYRGALLDPAMKGRYFFGDFIAGRVWSLGLVVDAATGEASASNLVEHTQALGGPQLGNVSSFGVDATGELYVVSYSTGKIVKIVGPPHAPQTPGGLRILR